MAAVELVAFGGAEPFEDESKPVALRLEHLGEAGPIILDHTGHETLRDPQVTVEFGPEVEIDGDLVIVRVRCDDRP